MKNKTFSKLFTILVVSFLFIGMFKPYNYIIYHLNTKNRARVYSKISSHPTDIFRDLAIVIDGLFGVDRYKKGYEYRIDWFDETENKTHRLGVYENFLLG